MKLHIAEELMGQYKKVRDEEMESGGLGLITNPNEKKKEEYF